MEGLEESDVESDSSEEEPSTTASDADADNDNNKGVSYQKASDEFDSLIAQIADSEGIQQDAAPSTELPIQASPAPTPPNTMPQPPVSDANIWQLHKWKAVEQW